MLSMAHINVTTLYYNLYMYSGSFDFHKLRFSHLPALRIAGNAAGDARSSPARAGRCAKWHDTPQARQIVVAFVAIMLNGAARRSNGVCIIWH